MSYLWRCKRVFISEGLLAEACDAPRNDDTGQAFTPSEYSLSNSNQTCREGNIGQILASEECTISNIGYTIRDYDVF